MIKGTRMMMKRGAPTPPLPYDAEVEYLESTGTQWIDTGVVGDIDTTIGITWLKTQEIQYAVAQNLMGAANGAWNNHPINLSMYHYGSIGFGNNGQSGWGVYHYTANTMYTVSLGKSGLFVNGAFVVSTGNSLTTINTVYPISIFSFNQGRGINEPGSFRCYGASIKSGDTLVRDFIPVRFTNEQDQTEGAMYDRVSGELFRNAGTGAFTIGPDKS